MVLDKTGGVYLLALIISTGIAYTVMALVMLQCLLE